MRKSEIRICNTALNYFVAKCLELTKMTKDQIYHWHISAIFFGFEEC